MKKLLVILLFLGLLGCAAQKPMTIDVTRDYGRVWCCCKVGDGMCCNWTTMCPGYIPGCFCD